MTPRLRNQAAIERARSCDSLKLCVGLPTVSVWPAMYSVMPACMRPEAASLASASAIFPNADSTLGTSAASISDESVLKFTSSCGMLTNQGASSTPTQLPCAS